MVCILKRMDPETAVEYLEKHGWRRIERKRKDIVVLQKETDGKFHQMIIPLDRELGDYCDQHLKKRRLWKEKHQKSLHLSC